MNDDSFTSFISEELSYDCDKRTRTAYFNDLVGRYSLSLELIESIEGREDKTSSASFKTHCIALIQKENRLGQEPLFTSNDFMTYLHS